MTEPAAPRLADRLSALVGQATARAEEPVGGDRLVDLESAVSAVADRVRETDQALRGHLDDVGGALVLRIDELAGSVSKQVSELSTTVHEAVGANAPTEPDASTGVLHDVAVAVTGLADNTEARLERVEAGLEAVRAELVAVGAGIAARVDEAALALAETLVSLLTGAAPATADRPASASPAPFAEVDAHEVEVEQQLAAIGVDEGGYDESAPASGLAAGVDAEVGEPSLEATDAAPVAAPVVSGSGATAGDPGRRKGLFRR